MVLKERMKKDNDLGHSWVCHAPMKATTSSPSTLPSWEAGVPSRGGDRSMELEWLGKRVVGSPGCPDKVLRESRLPATLGLIELVECRYDESSSVSIV